MQTIQTLLVVGVGLIGGSFALALKRLGRVNRVIGLDRNDLLMAQNLGIVDEISEDWQCAHNADVILIATPVGQIRTVFAELAAQINQRSLIIDVGSTKQSVIADARASLGVHYARFVPCHPIAGAEHSGAAAASAELFQNKSVVLTPEHADPQALSLAVELWQACGARVHTMSALEHDRIFAAVSHLPHLLAYGLVEEFAQRPEAEQLFRFAAGGFRDFTRIASSNPEMWRDICIANRLNIQQELDRYRQQLLRLEQMLDRADATALEQLFVQARNARENWLARS